MLYWHWSVLLWSVRLTTVALYSPVCLDHFCLGFSQFWMPLLDWSFWRGNRITYPRGPLLHELHWLRVPELIPFILCVLVYWCLHGTAHKCIVDSLRRTADVDGRRRLRSSISDTLVVAPTNRSTLGDCAFPVSASRAWDGLPSSVRAASSLSTFHQELKTLANSSGRIFGDLHQLHRLVARHFWHCI